MAVIPDTAAVRSRRTGWAMAGITVAVLIADQVTKSLVVAGRIANGSSFGWVTVAVIRNHGASGGLGSGYPILVTIAALAVTELAATLAVRASGRVRAAGWICASGWVRAGFSIGIPSPAHGGSSPARY